MKKFNCLLLLLLFAQIPYSQQLLSLNEAINKSVSNSSSIKIELMNTELAIADIEKMKSAQLPHIQLNHQYLISDDPLNAFGFKLKQSLIQAADFQPDLLNNPDIGYHGNTQVQLKQVIFHFDLINLKKGLKARLNAAKANSLRLEEKIVLEVKNAFTDLQYLYAAMETSTNTAIALKENEIVVNNIMAQGLAKKSDALRVKTEISDIELQILKLKHSIENLSAYLSFLMGDPMDAVYIPSQILVQDSMKINSSKLIERADFKSMQYMIDARIHSRKAVLHGIVPKLNAFGEFNFYDKQFFGFQQHSFLGGIQLQWDLFNGNSRAYDARKQQLEIKKSNYELDQAMTNAQLQLKQKLNELEFTKQELRSSENNLQFAEEISRITNERFKQGLEKTADVLNAEVLRHLKKLKTLEFTANHNKVLYELAYLSGTTNH